MQFRLYMNDTNDGSLVASELRKLANQLDGYPLNHGLTRSIQNGQATMDFEHPKTYESCADAEKQLGMTLDWTEDSTHHIGRAYGHVHAKVEKANE